MKYIDRFFDSYPKRVLAIYVVIIGILLYFQYHNASLSYALYQVEDINSLYKLLDVTSIYSSLIGRVIVGYLNFMNTSSGVIKILLYAFDLLHVVWFGLVIVFCLHGIDDDLFVRARWHVLFSIALEWLAICAVFLMAIIAMSSGTALIAITWIHRAAIVFGIVQVVLVILHLYLVFDTFYSISFEEE